MNIPKEPLFDKDFKGAAMSLWRKLFLSIVIILVASLSFGTGLLVAGKGRSEGVRIEYDQNLDSPQKAGSETSAASAVSALKELEAGVVASKNSDKYHYPHCSGAKRISEENRITFRSAEDAEASGYTLAGNCRKR